MTNETNKSKVPVALFNSKALFNPYQYEPFFKVMEWRDEKGCYMYNGNNLFITDEVGVGKTIEAGIIIKERLYNERDDKLKVLIICPVKLCENWKREMKTLFDLSFDVYTDKNKKRMNFLSVFNNDEENTRLSIIPYSYFVYGQSQNDSITDDDAENEEKNAAEDNDNKEVEIDTDKIKNLKYDILILDEAHHIRKENSKLYKYIEGLIRNNIENNTEKMKIFMTATPIFNGEEDYENVTSLLGKYVVTNTLQGEANCYDYILQIEKKDIVYSEKEKEIFKKIFTLEDKYGNIEEIDNYESWVSKKQEVEKGYRSKYGDLTGWLKRISASSIYSLNQYLNKPESYIEDGKVKKIKKSEVDTSDLKKLCNELISNLQYKDTKIIELKKLIDEESENEEVKKFIVFSCYISTCRYIYEQLKLKDDAKLESSKRDVFIVTGDMNTTQIEKEMKKFKDSKNKAILVCSDVAKEGHNLQFCNRIIHYDLPYTPAALIQRNGRIYRKNAISSDIKAYYLLDSEFYDARLWGEIISDKCEIIRQYGENEQIADINVLPENAYEFSKKVLGLKFDRSVTERMEKVIKEKN